MRAAEPGETVPGRPRVVGAGLASSVVFVGGLLVVAGIITLVVEQFVAGSADLATRVSTGLDTVQNWLVTGSFRVQEQIDSVVTSIKQAVLDNREAVTSVCVARGEASAGPVDAAGGPDR